MDRISFEEILELIEANRKSVIIKTVDDGTNIKNITEWPSRIVCAGKVIKDKNYPYGVEMFNPGIILEFHYGKTSGDGINRYTGCSVTSCLENKSRGYIEFNEFFSSCSKLWRLFNIKVLDQQK